MTALRVLCLAAILAGIVLVLPGATLLAAGGLALQVLSERARRSGGGEG